MRVRKGTDIDGHKVVEMLCGCGHSKSDHADKEIIGQRVKERDQYVIPITYEKNMGECTKTKCKRCYGYEVGAVLLDNGKILTFYDFFKCNECGKYLNGKKRAKSIYNMYNTCKACAPGYGKRRIEELTINILAIEELKEILVKRYPEQIEIEADFEVEYGYDYESSGTKNVYLSIIMVVDKLLAKLEKEKETWVNYK